MFALPRRSEHSILQHKTQNPGPLSKPLTQSVPTLARPHNLETSKSSWILVKPTTNCSQLGEGSGCTQGRKRLCDLRGAKSLCSLCVRWPSSTMASPKGRPRRGLSSLRDLPASGSSSPPQGADLAHAAPPPVTPPEAKRNASTLPSWRIGNAGHRCWGGCSAATVAAALCFVLIFAFHL